MDTDILKDKKLTELREIAKAFQIEGVYKLKKAELLEALIAEAGKAKALNADAQTTTDQEQIQENQDLKPADQGDVPAPGKKRTGQSKQKSVESQAAKGSDQGTPARRGRKRKETASQDEHQTTSLSKGQDPDSNNIQSRSNNQPSNRSQMKGQSKEQALESENLSASTQPQNQNKNKNTRQNKNQSQAQSQEQNNGQNDHAQNQPPSAISRMPSTSGRSSL
jgi:hypothetical protein